MTPEEAAIVMGGYFYHEFVWGPANPGNLYEYFPSDELNFTPQETLRMIEWYLQDLEPDHASLVSTLRHQLNRRYPR